jgi:hypothetical protein
MKRRAGNDPRWITTAYTAKCARPGCPLGVIPKGARAYYYPLTRAMYCETCGQDAERDFSAHLFDEGGR